MYLPVGPAWQRYLHLSSETYTDLENELSAALRRVAAAACRAAHDGAHRRDPWLWDLDWSVAEMKVKKSVARKRTDSVAAVVKDTELVKTEQKGKKKGKRKTTKKKSEDVSAAAAARFPPDWSNPVRPLTEAEFNSDAPLPDPLAEWFAPLWRTADGLYKRQPVLPGYPKWYRDLCNKDGSGEAKTGLKMLIDVGWVWKMRQLEVV